METLERVLTLLFGRLVKSSDHGVPFHKTTVLTFYPVIRYPRAGHVPTPSTWKVVDWAKWRSAVLCSLPTVLLCSLPALFMHGSASEVNCSGADVQVGIK